LLQHYHKRSNVESTFSAIKRKFGDSVMSKNPVAMVNEILCKILCHSLTCLIQEQETLGITPIFWKDEGQEDGERAILPLPQPREFLLKKSLILTKPLLELESAVRVVTELQDRIIWERSAYKPTWARVPQ
jgi:hypothetical protein